MTTHSRCVLTAGQNSSLLGKLQKAGLFNPPPVPLFGDDLRVDIQATGELPDGSSLIPQVKVRGNVSAKGIRNGPNAIDSVSLKTNLDIVEGKPKGTVDLMLNRVVAGLIRFKAISFRLTLDGTAYILEGSIVGPNEEKIASLRAHGAVDLPTRTVSATLDTFNVHHETMQVSLASPVTFDVPAGLELTKAPFVIPPIRLNVGDGWIDAKGLLHFDAQRMEGQEHEVLVLSDSDLMLTLHRMAPALPMTPKTRMMAKQTELMERFDCRDVQINRERRWIYHRSRTVPHHIARQVHRPSSESGNRDRSQAG